MKCPHCDMILSELIIKNCLDAATFEKFRWFLRNNLMEKDPLNRWCPNTKCSRVIRLFSLNEN